jgi:hypothetical protein
MLYVHAGGPEQPDFGDFVVHCQSAALMAGGKLYRAVDAQRPGYTIESCGAETRLSASKVQHTVVPLRFVREEPLEAPIELRLPEIRLVKSNTLLAAQTLELKTTSIARCPQEGSGWH